MGVIIFTRDAEPYRVGEFVEGHEVLTSPSCEGLTVIVHESRPKAQECLSWLPYISYRMVWVCDSAPEIKDNESVIYDKSMRAVKQDYMTGIQACLKWSDRNRAWAFCKDTPIPLMLSFLKANDKNIEMWRVLAKGFTWTPEWYQMAYLCFASKPNARASFPKKKQEEEKTPIGFRPNDKYSQIISSRDVKVGNDIRVNDISSLPKAAKKRKQKSMEWL